ncbi:tubulin folding cofactor D C terminal-domain-containing protein [Xylariaceae sp. FL0662B]|nr:tubulin folding cofactor D C terminal-domain-containing protein [Xylariaceae sp. FL0662B]
MDAPDQDRDIVIQRNSADLIADFDRSLEPFLRKPNVQLRRRVRTRESSRLISQVLEPFQELPQLLDPHLPKWIPVLAEAYLGCLQDHRRSRPLSLRSQLLTPLSNAICGIIYTFCKIRGEKVIVRFLNVETKYLELLLLAIEDSERGAETAVPWTWHERYVVLLWLSQLFLAPFDLSTISSGDADMIDRPVVRGFQWPPQIPGITLRVIPLAIKYLAQPGKERDGAKALLVRVAMRRDMQELGILHALVQWALSTLKPSTDVSTETPYYYIGSLSFLAGVLSASADTSMMNPHLSAIFYAIHAIAAEENSVFNVINGTALARKMMIKVIRSVITLVLRKSQQTMADTEMVETSIGYLLERLADNDTPVRLAASKALSIITLKLEPDMASQVIEAVLESLNRNVLWVKNKSNPSAPLSRDLTAVDPLEWHGLMLALSHLLYRRSPPPENLSDIIHALLMGLSFEKRGTSGSSIGTNVRDASCFGIWALARRYTTTELLRVQTNSVLVAKEHDASASILQVIATELVVTASLDPAGNIRRGASAALQELIGRHPDTVEAGISLVQTVDYHEVALRSRAIHEVALRATRLSTHYGRALMEATLGWRGIGDLDAGARRVAAASFGILTAELARVGDSDPLASFRNYINLLLSRLQGLQVRQVEERHGLLLCLAAVFDSLPSLLRTNPTESLQRVPTAEICSALKEILQDSKATKYRKPELMAEAASGLLVSSTPILLLCVGRQARVESQLETFLQPGRVSVQEGPSNSATSIAGLVDTLEEADRPKQIDELFVILRETLHEWFERYEGEVIRSSSEAALVLLIFVSSTNRSQIIKEWCDKVRGPQTSQTLRIRHGSGFFHALTRAYALERGRSDPPTASLVTKVLVERWAKDKYTDTRAAILQSLIGRAILEDKSSDLVGIVAEGLDDYTTTARGDVGSNVRLEAIRATKTLWGTKKDNEQVISALYPRVLRLAAEKLDRVRTEAQSALSMLLSSGYAENFAKLSFSSKDYFSFLLHLCDAERLDHHIAAPNRTVDAEACSSALLAGYVTSADTGNEDLVIASRAALADFCAASHENNLGRVHAALLRNLKQYQGQGQDRVVVPTLEVLAFLFHVGLLQQQRREEEEEEEGGGGGLSLRRLCALVQKAAYKTGNVRKLEACIRVYGAVAGVEVQSPEAAVVGGFQTTTMTPELLARKREEGVLEARRRLGALMAHPWPRVRNLVVDEFWGLMTMMDGGADDDDAEHRRAKLLAVDWAKADRAYIRNVTRELGFD